MSQFKGLRIETNLNSKGMEFFLRSFDNVFSPIGSPGGYYVKKSEVAGLWEFRKKSNSRHAYAVFVNGGAIYTTALAATIINGLLAEGIWFKAEPMTERPEEMEEFYKSQPE